MTSAKVVTTPRLDAFLRDVDRICRGDTVLQNIAYNLMFERALAANGGRAFLHIHPILAEASVKNPALLDLVVEELTVLAVKRKLSS